MAIESLSAVIDHSSHNEAVRKGARARMKEAAAAELEGMATIRDYRMSRMTGKFKEKQATVRPVFNNKDDYVLTYTIGNSSSCILLL